MSYAFGKVLGFYSMELTALHMASTGDERHAITYVITFFVAYDDIVLEKLARNFVTEKTSYGFGCTTTDKETAEINPFPICNRNTTSNTKGS